MLRVVGVSRANSSEARAQGALFTSSASERTIASAFSAEPQLILTALASRGCAFVVTPWTLRRGSLCSGAAHARLPITCARTATSTLAAAVPSAACWEFLAKNREESLNVVSLTGGVSYRIIRWHNRLLHAVSDFVSTGCVFSPSARCTS